MHILNRDGTLVENWQPACDCACNPCQRQNSATAVPLMTRVQILVRHMLDTDRNTPREGQPC